MEKILNYVGPKNFHFFNFLQHISCPNPGTACQLDDQAWFKPKKPKQEQQHKPQKEQNQQQNLLQRKVDDSW